MKQRRVVLGAMLSGLLLAAACSTAATDPSTSGPAADGSSDVARNVLPDLPTAIDELLSNDGSVVVGEATASRETPGNAEPDGTLITAGPQYIAATETDLRVTRSVAGPVHAGETVRIRQHGAPGNTVAGVPKMVQGNTYLVMIRPFEYAPGKPTGQFVVVGLDTIWQESDGTFRLLGAGADDPGARYPETITPERIGELVAAVRN